VGKKGRKMMGVNQIVQKIKEKKKKKSIGICTFRHDKKLLIAPNNLKVWLGESI